MNFYVMFTIVAVLLELLCFLSLILIRKRKKEIEILEMKIDVIMLWLGKTDVDIWNEIRKQQEKQLAVMLKKMITRLEEERGAR